MRKPLLVFGFFVFLGAYALPYEPRSKGVKGESLKGVMGESSFVVPANETPSLQVSAKNGDCNLAYKLGMHHFFVSLQYNEATRWFRLAAKCPDVRSKEALIAALLTEKNQTSVTTEIDNLISEIRKIDPERAKKAEENVRHSRK